MKAGRDVPRKAGTYMRKAPGWEQHGWTSTPNALSRDPEIDWDAKGAYGWIASHLELAFPVSAESLAAAGPRGRDHAYGMVKTLEAHGWLTRERYRADDGRGTVHIWTLHFEAVPPDERTHRPSTAKPRASRLARDGSAAPEILDGQEVQNPDALELEPAAQAATPGRSGSPTGEAPGNPERPVPARPGVPYMEETLPTREDQGEGETAQAAATPEPAAGDAPPPLKADWSKPETCLCAEHLAAVTADPGVRIPSCTPCRRVREWGEGKRAARAAELAVIDQTADERARACTWHEEAGWVVDPATRLPFVPALRCDHVSTSPASVAARIAAQQRPVRPSSTASGRAAARAQVTKAIRARKSAAPVEAVEVAS